MAENLLQHPAQHDRQARDAALERALETVEQAQRVLHERRVAQRRAAIAAHDAEAARLASPPAEQVQSERPARVARRAATVVAGQAGAVAQGGAQGR